MTTRAEALAEAEAWLKGSGGRLPEICLANAAVAQAWIALADRLPKKAEGKA